MLSIDAHTCGIVFYHYKGLCVAIRLDLFDCLFVKGWKQEDTDNLERKMLQPAGSMHLENIKAGKQTCLSCIKKTLHRDIIVRIIYTFCSQNRW